MKRDFTGEIVFGVAMLVMAGMFLLGCKNTAPIVEDKVVEIHMTATAPAKAEDESRGKMRESTVVTLPFAAAPTRRGTCSGAFVSSTGGILTARHCVDGYDQFEVQTHDMQSYRAIVIAKSETRDLALIRIDRLSTPYFTLARRAFRGQRIFILGSPLGITGTLSTGIIAKIHGDLTLVDCSALPGNSGGPVFNENGELVGILTAGFVVYAGTTHLNLAQGLDAIRFFLEGIYGDR